MSRSAQRNFIVFGRNVLFGVAALATVGFALFRGMSYSSAAVTVPYNSNSVWNQAIAASPALDPSSSQKIQLLASTINGAINIDGIDGAWSVPVYTADATTPHYQVCDSAGYAPCESVPIPAGLLPSPD